eukprot:8315105-Ditylum_brightwellii.AAC.1
MPQDKNEKCDAYTINIATLVSTHTKYELINITSDGLSSEQNLIQNQAKEFMSGKTNTVGFIVPNHLFKAVRSRLILGSSIKSICGIVVDP